MSNTTYVYQIMGILEHPETKKVGGVRVVVCTANIFEQVDVPAECMQNEMLAYLRYRSAVCNHFDVRKLPNGVQNELRNSIGRWLDDFIIKKLA